MTEPAGPAIRALAEPGQIAVFRSTGQPVPTVRILDYEGHVVYADGTLDSLQCFEGRCYDCPDEVPDGEIPADGDGPFGGYPCEHGCGHGPASDRVIPSKGELAAAALSEWLAKYGDVITANERYNMHCLAEQIEDGAATDMTETAGKTPGKPKTATEAARMVRTDIKQAAGNGSLGELPAYP